MKLRLEGFRLSYPDLFVLPKPIVGAQGEPKYGAHLIQVPGSRVLKATNSPDGKTVWVPTTLDAAVLAVATEKWKANAANVIEALAKDKKCVRNGNANLDKSGAIREGYEGNQYVVAKNKVRPTVIDRDKTQLTQADGKPYGGCYVHASIEIYATDKPGIGKSINASLGGVQFYKDGDAFGGGAPASPDDFDDLAIGEEEESLV